jgi:8-oxo-dGTP diphosphatase
MPTSTFQRAFGLAVRLARTRRGWTQAQLAAAAKLDAGHVSQIETGQRDVALSTQERLADALDVSLAELVAEAERERERYELKQPEPSKVRRRKPAAPAAEPRPSSSRPPVAMAIIVQDSLALMTHRRYKEPAFQWNFVSGQVEAGETPEEAAIREVREEVGLEVSIDHRLGDRIQPVSKRHMYYYICRVIDGDVDLVDHEENIDVAWCTLDEVYEHFEELAQIPGGMYPPLFEYLDRVLAKNRLAAQQAHHIE